MTASIAADAIFLLHLCFIVFVVFGGLLVLKIPRLAWIHLPMVLWASVVNWIRWVCPLTPVENYLRQLAGQTTYNTGFIQNYLVPIIYPENMSYEAGVYLGLGVFVWNSLLYGYLMYKNKKSR